MPRFFNTTGPCQAERHYMLPPEERMPDLLPLVQQQLCFVLRAPRQTGKTTAMIAFAARLRELGIVGLYTTFEISQGREELEQAEALWLASLLGSARLQLPSHQQPPKDVPASVGNRLARTLTQWSEQLSPAPLVLLLDEVDVVRGPVLINLLRQLRAGFPGRPGHFPASVALVGMRDLRDYLSHAKDGAPVNPGSPFNIKAASITLRNFTAEEVVELYAQHTADTGQAFEPEASARSFWWTRGQPFLVNALARIAVMELVPEGAPITAAHIDEAKERLIRSRTTHLDSLAERLKEARVARIMQPVLLGDVPLSVPYDHDDFDYVIDLGLLVRGPDGMEPANPLYREVLARQLSHNIEAALNRPRWRWQTDDGRLDFPALVEAFLQWWRENEAAVYAHGNKGYPEVLPHLAFMAFLQRVVNGGGTVTREYAAGRRALDLVVGYGPDRFVVELKRVFVGGRSLERVRQDGIEQLADYLDTLGEREGWLVIFDQRPGRSWEERLWEEEVVVGGRLVRLRGA
jgi:hypothetical protein